MEGMRKLLARDLKDGLCNRYYLLSVLLIVLFAFVSLGVNYQYYPGVFTAGGLTLFLHGTALSLGNIFQSVAPVASVIPCSLFFLEDMDTGNLQYQLTRVSSGKYLLSRFVSTFLVSGSVFPCAYAIMLIICTIISPVASYRINFSPLVAFREVYDSSLAAFIIIFTINSFLFGGSYGVFAMGIASFFRKKVWGLLFPIIFYHASIIIAWLFPQNVIYDIVYWIPYESFDIQTTSALRLIYSHVLISITGGIGVVLANMRYRYNGK